MTTFASASASGAGPDPGVGAGDLPSVVGFDRHQTLTDVVTESHAEVANTSDQERHQQRLYQQSPPRDIISSSPTNIHPLLQVASAPPHSRSTTAAAATITSPTSESLPSPLGSSKQLHSTTILAPRAYQAPADSSLGTMFSDIYKSPRSPIAKLRHHSVQLQTPLPANTPDWYDDDHADLLSKDKAKQKDAVRRYLDAKVKNDWSFSWPSRVVDPPPVEGDIAVVKPEHNLSDATQPTTSLDVTESTKPVQDETCEDIGYQVDDSSDDDDGSDVESIYSTVSDDPARFRTRLEWTSDLSDDDDDNDEPGPSRSPFRFDNPNNVGSTIQAAVHAKRAKRRRAVRKEMEWNEGLACFEARRNEWTGARTVRVRAKPATPPAVSPLSPRRFFFRRSISTSPPSSTMTSTLPPRVSDGSDNSSLARSEELRNAQSKDTTPSTPPDSRNYPVEVLLPLAPPLLPPSNPLRASITPSVYLSLYDKVIIHSLQPSCPINLSDMLRACVTGWKRDGEWPPRPTMAPTPVAKKKKKAKKASNPSENSSSTVRRMSFGLLGRDKDETAGGKGIRRSIVRAFGIGEGADTPK
ncbi:atrophin [Fusarium heterosporum]|uniref:Atrophin n=1 Tax=Fusarium heterosporum TaxID=42747 RepID=A0A8H5WLR8_FUSHE|nr:atrophin [Fusarium heterosporum]